MVNFYRLDSYILIVISCIMILRSLYGNEFNRRERITVLVEMPHIQSLASLVLLKKFYERCDRSGDKKQKKRQWRVYLTFRNRLLKRRKKEFGDLVCYLCGKTGLIANVNSPNAKNREATIDHKVPISKGGKTYCEKNCEVACLKCNTAKADKLL